MFYANKFFQLINNVSHRLQRKLKLKPSLDPIELSRSVRCNCDGHRTEVEKMLEIFPDLRHTIMCACEIEKFIYQHSCSSHSIHPHRKSQNVFRESNVCCDDRHSWNDVRVWAQISDIYDMHTYIGEPQNGRMVNWIRHRQQNSSEHGRRNFSIELEKIFIMQTLWSKWTIKSGFFFGNFIIEMVFRWSSLRRENVRLAFDLWIVVEMEYVEATNNRNQLNWIYSLTMMAEMQNKQKKLFQFLQTKWNAQNFSHQISLLQHKIKQITKLLNFSSPRKKICNWNQKNKCQKKRIDSM